MGHTPQSAAPLGFARSDLSSAARWSLGYSGVRPLVWWYLTEFPQGRKAARAGELFQVRGGSSHAPIRSASSGSAVGGSQFVHRPHSATRLGRESDEPTRLGA